MAIIISWGTTLEDMCLLYFLFELQTLAENGKLGKVIHLNSSTPFHIVLPKSVTLKKLIQLTYNRKLVTMS